MARPEGMAGWLRAGGKSLLAIGLALSISVCTPERDHRPRVDVATPVSEIGSVRREFSGAVGVGGDSTFLYPVSQVSTLPGGLVAFGMSRGAAALAVVDTTGALVSARGENGDGPGQFRSVSGLYADSLGILVWDGRLRRLTRFTGHRNPTSETMSIPVQIGEAPLGIDPHGTFWTEAPPGARMRGKVVLKGWPESGAAPVTLGLEHSVRPPLSAPATVRGGRGNGSIVLHALSGSCLPTTLFGWLGGEIAIVDTGSGEIASIAGGALVNRATAPHEVPVSDELQNRIREEVVGSLDWERRSRPPGATRTRSIIVDESVIDSVASLAASTPVASLWDRALPDPWDGHLWLRRATCFSEESERIWDVLSAEGIWLAEVRVSGGRRLRAVAPDFVVTSREDDMGVIHFGIHDIVYHGETTPRRSRSVSQPPDTT